jgi:alanine-glyoxylate transaminase / serine-glyoxylate transaminase / serine-pyruvate transaminase
MAQVLGVEVEVLPGDWRRAVDPAAVEARLKADTAGEIKAVLVVQIDTASSVVNDIPPSAGPSMPPDMMRSISSTPSPRSPPCLRDGRLGRRRRGGGIAEGPDDPAGPGLHCRQRQGAGRTRPRRSRDPLLGLDFRDGEEHYMKYCGTPPEHLMFGLRRALDLLLAEGLHKVIERHRLLAGAVHAAVDTWRQGGALDFNIEKPQERSAAVTTVLCPGCAPKAILDFCRETCGVTLGLGIGGMGDKAFRIAHMGHVNAPMVLGTLGSIEVALVALGIAHGEGGVQAAADSLGRALASSRTPSRPPSRPGAAPRSSGRARSGSECGSVRDDRQGRRPVSKGLCAVHVLGERERASSGSLMGRPAIAM